MSLLSLPRYILTAVLASPQPLSTTQIIHRLPAHMLTGSASSSQADTATTTPFRILDLLFEMRNRIHAFAPSSPCDRAPQHRPAGAPRPLASSFILHCAATLRNHPASPTLPLKAITGSYAFAVPSPYNVSIEPRSASPPAITAVSRQLHHESMAIFF
jgi:hypothetical protein